MANMFRTSHAKVKLYRKCRAAFNYKYNLKLKKKTVPRPLQFGRMVHEMIEEQANGKDPFKHLAKIAKRDERLLRLHSEDYGDIVDDVRIIMTEYYEFWKNSDMEYISYNGKKSEHSFAVEIAPGIEAIGYIDNFARANKLRWLVEHKSGKNMLNDDHRWRNLQSAVYIRLVDMIGLRSLDGTLWDFIRSKPPSAPQLLKNGDLSARGLDTLPLKVTETFKEMRQKMTSKHEALLKQARANRQNYFKRVFNPLKKNVVDFLYDGFVRTSKEMADNQGNKKMMSEMNIDRHCDWCEFESLCRARLQNLDYDFTMKREYEKREKTEEFEPDFEA